MAHNPILVRFEIKQPKVKEDLAGILSSMEGFQLDNSSSAVSCDHQAFTRDAAWLRDFAWPLLRGAAEFTLDWLVPDGKGGLATAPSFSPENTFRAPDGSESGTGLSTTSDVALLRELFTNAIEASTIFDVDAALRREMEEALAKLPPYKVGRRGQLQEWYLDWDDPEPEHRHPACLQPREPRLPDQESRPNVLAARAQRALPMRGGKRRRAFSVVSSAASAKEATSASASARTTAAAC